MLLVAALAVAGPPLTAPPADPAAYPDLTAREVVTVLVLGDTGVGKAFAPVARAAAERCADRVHPCDLALLVGDNVYEDGITAAAEDDWVEAFATPMAPFADLARSDARFRAWVVAGNHDWAHDTGSEGAGRVAAAVATTSHPANAAIGNMWQFPALAYSVPGLPSWLHLHGIDTESFLHGAGPGVLDVTRAAMRATDGWDVVFGHHFPVSTGSHGRARLERDDEIYARALQSLRPDGLALVFAGHDHHQELLVTGGVPVVIQGNSSKGREVGVSKYSGCSRWVNGGRDARGFTIATFREDTVDIEFFDGGGAPLHQATFRRDAVPTQGPRIGTCAR